MTFILVWLGGPASSPTGAQILFAYRDVQNAWMSAALYQRSAIGQSAWVRADYVVQDHASGALPSCLRSGGNEAYPGIERIESSELARLGKGNLQGEVRRALKILHHDFLHVFTVASLIYGFSGDTPESVRLMFRRGHELRRDEIFFIPVTPWRGTPYWWESTGEKFRGFSSATRATIPPRLPSATHCIGLVLASGLASSVGSEMSSAGMRADGGCVTLFSELYRWRQVLSVLVRELSRGKRIR